MPSVLVRFLLFLSSYFPLALIFFIQIVEADGKQMLRYDPTNKWVLLKLLDDDYLWSQMTRQSYEVTGKRELEQD